MKTTLLLIATLAARTNAQTTIKDALVQHWKVTSDFTIAVAKLMPPADYGFRPVPAELSFSQVMIQVAAANLSACAIGSGLPRPAIPAKIAQAVRDDRADAGKDLVLQFLSDSFDFCNRAVASMTPAKLDAMVGPEARKMTAFEWIWAYFTHTAHHRGQLEVYLRLKGIQPPEYVF